jgi:ATP-dependent RNA helicase RhlE
VLVFTRTKHGADRVARHLVGAGIEAAAIHGNKSQPQRERALAGFRAGHSRVLVATDIAARGIDVECVSHVINFELPNVPEDYVHRIGRTARAGAAGIANSFCSDDERPYLRDIEKLTRGALSGRSGPIRNPCRTVGLHHRRSGQRSARLCATANGSAHGRPRAGAPGLVGTQEIQRTGTGAGGQITT